MEVKSGHQAQIKFENNNLSFYGSFYLFERLHGLKQAYGPDPIKWSEVSVVRNEDILINEFIAKLQGRYQLAYGHEELCHCRLISTETVVQAIKQGCRNVDEVARATRAGTGCGTCRPNTQKILDQLWRRDSKSE